MKTRNTLIALAAAAATVTGMAAPAFAGPKAAVTVTVAHRDYDRWDHNRRDERAERRVENRISQLRQRIETGRRNGQISRREADRLQGQLRGIVTTKMSFERSGRGLTSREVAVLDSRIDNLSGQIRFERRDHNRW